MAAATRMFRSAHSSSSSSVSPPSPWHPVVLVPIHHHQHHQVLYDDLDLATPSPTTPAATGSPPGPRSNHNHLRAAASRQLRAGKQPRRRPRPLRKLPTTYISADAASFRRMVHQVTGFDDDDVPLLQHLHGGPVVAPAEPEVLLCRRQAPAPAPPRSRAGLETSTLLLPTLDTSAFLMLGAAGGGAARPAVSSCFHGSAAAAVDPGAAALQVKAEETCGGGAGGGLPSQAWIRGMMTALSSRSPSML